MKTLIFLLQLLAMLLIFFITYTLYKPSPVKRFYNRYYYPVSNFTEHESTTIDDFRYKNQMFQRYLLKNKSSDTLIVWFHGGCFLQEHPRLVLPFLGLLRKSLPNCDILTFDYPLPFDYTLHDSLASSVEVIRGEIENGHYTNHYIAGDSAGAFFAVLVANLQNDSTLSAQLDVERLPMKTFNGLIIVSGFLDATFGNKMFLEKCFQFYIARNTRNFHLYRTDRIFIPSMIFTSKHDFLYQQNVKFALRNIESESHLKVYEADTARHDYISYTNIPETFDTVKIIDEFIENYNR